MRPLPLALLVVAGCGPSPDSHGRPLPGIAKPSAVAVSLPAPVLSASSAQAAPAAAPSANELPPGPRPPAPPSPPAPLRVLVGGDLLPHRPSLAEPASIRQALAPLGALFGTADAVVANFEAATGELDPKLLRMVYVAPPGWIDALSHAGLRAITVANNHACDLGEDGVRATLAAATEAGVAPVGGDLEDAFRPRVLAERDGKRVCAIAWTTFVNGRHACGATRLVAIAPPTRAGRARIDHAISAARAACDATIAIVHGGEEYVPQTELTLDQARHAAEAGADAVVIHHPHVASPVVVHTTRDGRSVPIFASVGNLATNQGESWKPTQFPVFRQNRRLVCVNGWTRLGVLADLAFSFEGRRTRLDWGYHLTWTENEHADNRALAVPRIATRVVDANVDTALLARFSEDHAGPTALFTDPCWFERAGADPSVPRAVRCEASHLTDAPLFASAASTAAPLKTTDVRPGPAQRRGRPRER